MPTGSGAGHGHEVAAFAEAVDYFGFRLHHRIGIYG